MHKIGGFKCSASQADKKSKACNRKDRKEQPQRGRRILFLQMPPMKDYRFPGCAQPTFDTRKSCLVFFFARFADFAVKSFWLVAQLHPTATCTVGLGTSPSARQT